MSATAVRVLLDERVALCDTLEKYGPDAPTLCRGWRTLDLAAHLVAREARSDAALGLVLPGPFATHLQHVMDRYKARGYEPLVRMLRSGPPWMHRQGPLASANVNENFVHHEDVRRASGEGPRQLPPDFETILWHVLGFGTRMARRKLHGVAFVVRTPDGRERVVSTEGREVTMTGEVGELTLFMSGRTSAADVRFDGDREGIALVLAADFGV
jgi:uncharacterized protein (TIGR03085 family)